MNIKCALSLAVAVILWPLVALAQETNPPSESDSTPVVIKQPNEIEFKYDHFTFARIQYFSNRSRSGAWKIDYPDADQNLAAQFEKLTGMKSSTLVLPLTDPSLDQYPFIFLTEGGHLRLREAEVVALRKYLLNGGFLLVDDFWGEDEWRSLAGELKRVFPDRVPMELPIEHEIFRCFYEITEKPQLPSIAHAVRYQGTGITWEREDGKEAHYRGLVDDKGRLMAVLCHNTDLSDGWERVGENEYYTREFSLKKAFPMGINIVVYALSN